MSVFFNRKFVVEVADLNIETLKIDFEIKREASTTPASGNVTILNLSKEKENQIVERGKAITITAGYANQIGIIFDGKVQRIEREQDFQGKTRKTIISLTQKSLIQPPDTSLPPQLKPVLVGNSEISFIGSRPLKSVVSLLVADMGVDVGALNHIPDDTISDYSFSGASAVALGQLLNPRKISWYDDNGVINFTSPKNQSTNQTDTIFIDDKSGLIGAPTITDDGCRIRSLLKYQARIGTLVNLTSQHISGIYKITALVHQGDNRNGDFFTDMTLKPNE